MPPRRPTPTPAPRLALTHAALLLVFAHPVSALDNLLPTNLPWAEDVRTLAAHALADARAAAVAPATTTGFIVERKNSARILLASANQVAASATPSAAAANPTATAFADALLHQMVVLTHNRLALIIGCSIAVALFVITLVFFCRRGRRANSEAATPTTPFADRATSLPTSKGRRRSYKTLHE